MDEFTIGFIGTVTGILGLAIAVVSYHKQMQLEARFKDKEKMLSLAPKVRDLIDHIKFLYLPIFDIPSMETNEDTYQEMNSLSNAIVSMAFDEKLDAIPVATEAEMVFSDLYGNLVEKSRADMTSQETDKKLTKSIIIKKTEDVDRYMRKYEINYICISCFIMNSDEETFGFDMLLMPPISNDINRLLENYGDIIERFSPGLMTELDESIKNVLGKIMISAIKNNDILINISEFNKTKDIGPSIYKKIIGIDEIKGNLNEIKEIMIRLEKLRETLLTTGYA